MRGRVSKPVKIHIFGDSVGESILLESPDGWGMIDCFKYKDTVPPLEFLSSKNVSCLRFLCLTHPHKDHYEGMDKVVDHFLDLEGLDAFWRYPTLSAKEFFAASDFKMSLLRGQTKMELEKAIDGLKRAFDRLSESIKKGRTELRRPDIATRLFTTETDSEPLLIDSLAPTGAVALQAEQNLVEWWQKREAQNLRPYFNLNKLSLALRVSWAGYNLVLGGDTPSPSWSSSFRSEMFPKKLNCVAYKASHHGSKKDNSKRILTKLTSTGEVSVVTRYSKSALPREEGLASLRQRFSRLIVLGRANLDQTDHSVKREPRYSVQRVALELDRSGINVRGPVDW